MGVFVALLCGVDVTDHYSRFVVLVLQLRAFISRMMLMSSTRLSPYFFLLEDENGKVHDHVDSCTYRMAAL